MLVRVLNNLGVSNVVHVRNVDMCSYWEMSHAHRGTGMSNLFN